MSMDNLKFDIRANVKFDKILEIKQTNLNWFQSKDGLRRWGQRMTKCLELAGGCAEKMNIK
jgi:hypothetical protein